MNGSTFGVKKKAAIFLNVVVMIGLALVASAVVVYITGFTTVKRRIDLTQAETYSLTRDTLSLLSRLEKDVEIVTVTDAAAAGAYDPEGVIARSMEYVRDLLEEYEVRAAGRIVLEHVDVHRDAPRVRDLQVELGVLFYNYVLVRCGENRRVLQLAPDLAEILPGDQSLRRPTQLVAYRVEEAISSAIFGIVDDEKPIVYVVSGHDEEVVVSRTTPTGGSLLPISLGRDNIDVRDLPLFQTKVVPQDAAVVFLIGPRTPLLDDERSALDGYLRRGGRLLLALDPVCDDSLDPWLDSLGIEIERNLILRPIAAIAQNEDPRIHYLGGSSNAPFGQHPIVDELRTKGVSAVFENCAALQVKAGFERDVTTLASSHPSVFGDIPSRKPGLGVDPNTIFDYQFDARVETRGQRTFAVAVEPSSPGYAGARIVVASSWLAFSNTAIGRYTGNDRLLRHATSWLIGKKQGAIAPPPRLPPAMVTELKPEEYDQIAFYTMVVLPGAALLMSILVWWARRS